MRSGYKGSHAAPLRRRIKVGWHPTGGPGPGGVQSISWHEIKLHLIRELGLVQEGPTGQPRAAFTARGERSP